MVVLRVTAWSPPDWENHAILWMLKCGIFIGGEELMKVLSVTYGAAGNLEGVYFDDVQFAIIVCNCEALVFDG